jgi:hypothetical protein
MAQVLAAGGPSGQVYSTTNKGSILFSNDLLSLASLSRVAGGKPLDEAIVNDTIFRVHSYAQHDKNRMNKLAESVKTSGIQGRESDEEQMNKFATGYAAAGGRQENFNKWTLNAIKNANRNEAEKITQQLNNPFAYKVQLLMGGDSYSGNF